MPFQRVLIVGGTGFVGGHLRDALAGGCEVIATGREADVRDRDALRALVARVRPDAVVNLAAITTVRETVEDPRTAYATNHQGAQNLVAALQAEGFAGRLLQVSSSEVYGHPDPALLPLTEDAPLAPASPYAFAKLMAEHAALAARGQGFAVMVARSFTHIGPGQGPRFAVARFAREVAAITAGRAEPVIRVGSLAATRDFADVRDVARAYVAMLEAGEDGAIYNVCSGVETPMRAVLDALIALGGRPIDVVEDEGLVRAAEASRLRGDAGRLSTAVGWAPQIALSRTLADILEDATSKLGPGAT